MLMTPGLRKLSQYLTHPFWQCLLGLTVAVLATVGQRVLREHGVVSFLLLPYPAVLVAVGAGGVLAGVVAAFATALGLAYFTLEPSGSFVVAAQRDALDLVLFCAISMVIIVMSDRRTKALKLATTAQQRAEAASASKEALIAVVAHDLRNPLQTDMLIVELLASRLGGDEVGQGLLERMRRSTDRASRLIDDVLEQVQHGSDLLRVCKSPCSLAELVEETVLQFEPIAADQAITLERPAPHTLEGTLSCDKQRIVQVLSNLIGNAMKFTPRGGKVRLDVRRESDAVHFAVSDTGCGMSPNDLAHCFERLWHGAARGHGTGLGLWIAKTLVAAHGGQITAESELGRGTTIRFVLPVEAAAATAPITHPFVEAHGASA
jgi:signal transduction histidine kinase